MSMTQSLVTCTTLLLAALLHMGNTACGQETYDSLEAARAGIYEDYDAGQVKGPTDSWLYVDNSKSFANKHYVVAEYNTVDGDHHYNAPKEWKYVAAGSQVGPFDTKHKIKRLRFHWVWIGPFGGHWALQTGWKTAPEDEFIFDGTLVWTHRNSYNIVIVTQPVSSP